MAENFESLKAKILDWLAIDAVRLPDAVRGDILNIVQRQTVRNHDLRFAEISDTMATVASASSYTLPTNWRSPLNLWYISPNTGARVDLGRIPKDEFDTLYPDATKTGSPANYTVWGDLIYLGPTPDAILTVNRNYYGFLTDLADGSPNNTNAFVEEAWDVLLYGALGYACRYLLEDPRAPIWEGRYIELEQDLAREHHREKSAGRIIQSREPS